MAEEKSLKEIDELIGTLEQESVKSKEYLKFIIGLATGTLVFSVTFLSGLVPSPEYKLILIIGWFSLLISITAGVLLLPKTDELHSHIRSLKYIIRSSELFEPIIKKEYQEHYLKSLIKDTIDPIVKSDETKKEVFRIVDNLPIKGLKRYLKGLLLLGVKDPKTISYMNETIKEIFKLLTLSSNIIEAKMNPAIIFKNVRKTIFQIEWFDRFMKYAFFIGIFTISVFSIINFL